MLTAVVTSSASPLQITFHEGVLQAEEGESGESEGPESDLNPIFPEAKEVVWGFGAFVVLALVLRLFLFRKVRDGMTARYDRIESDFQAAEATTAAARADVAEYDAQVTAARAEAQKQVEAARAELEAERSVRLAEVNARIAEKRAAAAAEVDAAKLAARSQVESAVADVASFAGQLATGKTPSTEAVTNAVTEAMGVSA